jgi:arsenate reductase
MLHVYHYPNCDTCKKALKWLDGAAVEYEKIHIVEAPPKRAELKRILELSGLPLGKLFNTSGVSYRSGNFKEKLPSMSQSEALAALAADGKLIKRPLVVGKDVALVGFREVDYASALG